MNDEWRSAVVQTYVVQYMFEPNGCLCLVIKFNILLGFGYIVGIHRYDLVLDYQRPH